MGPWESTFDQLLGFVALNLYTYVYIYVYMGPLESTFGQLLGFVTLDLYTYVYISIRIYVTIGVNIWSTVPRGLNMWSTLFSVVGFAFESVIICLITFVVFASVLFSIVCVFVSFFVVWPSFVL